MPSIVAYILGAIVALGGAIVAFILIVPDKKRDKLNGFFRYVHDLFNFKSLWLEKIMKFLYIYFTLLYVAVGVFLLMSVDSFYGYSHYNGGIGILLILFGPIFTRIFFEGVMLFILGVKNIIEINNKLVPQEGSVADKKAKEEKARKAAQAAPVQPQYQQYAQPQYQQPQQYAQPTYPQYQYPDQNK